MAQLDTKTQQTVERQLEWALWQWSRLPEVEATIDNWDQVDQIVYITEWPLEEERLKRLEEYRADGAMTPEQQGRHDELRRIVNQNRPIIRRLQQT